VASCLLLILVAWTTAGQSEKKQPEVRRSAPQGTASSAPTTDGIVAGEKRQGGSRAPALQVRYPERDEGVRTLEARGKAQIEAAKKYAVFHGFRFTDRQAESGITFRHRIVSDAGRTYKAVHYDHGNGIAAADVDGDGLADLYFVNQVGGNQLWKNLGGGKFRDVTHEAGVALEERISVAASFADVDNDGDADLFVTTVRGGNALLLNDGRGRFRDVSAEAGVDLRAHSSGAVFFDYDNDGLVDLFVCNVGRYTSEERGPDGEYRGLRDAFRGHMHGDRAESSALYRNVGGGKFRDVSDEVGLRDRSWSGDATFADLNGDGWPDLYVLNMQGDDHYYQNEGGKRFAARTAAHFPKTPWGSMGVKFFDFDNDGQMDLYVTDMHSDMWEDIGPEREKLKARRTPDDSILQGGGNNIFGNALYRGRGKGRFEEISDRAGAENYWPWGLSVGDVNADGWEDAFLTSSMNYPFRYGINSLLLNENGKRFVDSEFVLGVEPRRDGRTHTPWFEMNCDVGEKLDNNLTPAEPCAGRKGRIEVQAALGSRSSVIFDLDSDGDMDIVTNDFNSAPMVLISDLAERRAIRWLKVRLEGTASNRGGLGARVTVRTGGRAWVKYHDGKSGYLSQSDLPLYFGLGDAEKIESVEVLWPSGRKQVVAEGVQVNQVLRVKEPE